MRSLRWMLAGLILLGGLSAPGADQEPLEEVMSVQLDLLGGGGGPSWRLSPAEVKEMWRRLSRLGEPSDAKWPEDSALGFRGFVVRITPLRRFDVEAEVVKVGFHLVAQSGRRFLDTAGIEDWLMELARARGFTDFITVADQVARGCGEESPAPLALVELDVFSGMPNPQWPLSLAEARELQRRLTDLPGASDVEGRRARPVYRGFRFSLQACGEAPRLVRVDAGLVRVGDRDGRSERQFRDNTGVEDWLRQSAVERGHARLVQDYPVVLQPREVYPPAVCRLKRGC